MRAVDAVVIMPKKLTAVSILKFEDELEDLCHKLSSGALTKSEEAITEARIKEIGEQLCPGMLDPLGRDFRSLALRRLRSSGDLADYCALLNSLFMQAATEWARNQRKNLKNLISHRPNTNIRDMQMAREFLRLRPTSDVSGTDLKAAIGMRRKLGRTASIDAINRGLRLLDKEDGCKRK
jgi:hypothetical protein